MQIILKEDVSNIEESYKAITVTSLDSLDVAVCRSEFSDLTESERASFANVLNEINNQGIVSINEFCESYTIASGKRLRISSMSSGEKLFALGFLASVRDITVLISSSMLLFDRDTFVTFCRRFGKAVKLYIITDDIHELKHLRRYIND